MGMVVDTSLLLQLPMALAHHSTRGCSFDVIFGSETQTDLFWNQNFGTTQLQEKLVTFALFPFS